MGSKSKLWLLVCLLLLPFAAFAQFDFGPGGAPDTSPWKSFKLSTKKRIKLDFTNASVDAIVRFYATQSGVSIVKDPALTGTLTVTSAAPVSLDTAFSILNTTLDLKGYEMSKKDNLLVIRNKNQGGGGRGNGGQPSFDPSMLSAMMGGNTNLKVYPITYANASQIARVINEVFSSNGGGLGNLMQMMGGGNNRFGGNNGRNGRFGGGNTGFNPMSLMGGGNQPNVHASSDDFSNSVIVNAPNQQQQQVEDLIRRLDKKTDDPLKTKVFKLNFASSDDLQSPVQNVLNTTAPRGRGGATTTQTQGPQAFINALRGQTAGSGTVTSDPRTNSLIVSATQENLDLVSQVIAELDTEVKVESSAIVVPLDNAKADQIATLMQQAFGTRSGLNGGGGQRTGTTGGNNTGGNRNTNGNTNNRGGAGGGGGNRGLGGLGPQQPVAQNDPDGKNLQLALEDPNNDSGELMTSIGVQQGGGFRLLGQGGGAGGQRGGQSSTLQGRDANGRLINVRDLTNQVTVIPDINTNSLIIVATPDQADLLRSIIEQLDKIPEQVMIETMIVEANLDAATKLGVEWNFTSGQTTTKQGFGIQGNTTDPPTGFQFTLAGNNLKAFINAVQTDTRFTILSTPRIFTSNNTQAQINISQSIPYVLSTIQDANGNLSFNYAFQDVGIVLTVTPRITSNGYVTLDVTQTANDLQSFTSFNAPIINQREAQTTVSVKDGETIILGGIIRNTVSTTTKKIPLLGDIPILGNLFKSTSHDKAKTELIVLLTPHVVSNPDDARRLRENSVKQLSPSTQKSLKDNPPVTKGGTTPPPNNVNNNNNNGGGKTPPPLR